MLVPVILLLLFPPCNQNQSIQGKALELSSRYFAHIEQTAMVRVRGCCLSLHEKTWESLCLGKDLRGGQNKEKDIHLPILISSTVVQSLWANGKKNGSKE